MKISECQKCSCYERRTWSSSYKPQNYHAIGISHAYGYCRLACTRCSDVKPYMCPKKRYGDKYNIYGGTVIKSCTIDENITTKE